MLLFGSLIGESFLLREAIIGFGTFSACWIFPIVLNQSRISRALVSCSRIDYDWTFSSFYEGTLLKSPAVCQKEV